MLTERWSGFQPYVDYYERAFGPVLRELVLCTGSEYVLVRVGDQFHLGDGAVLQVLMFQAKADPASRNRGVVCGYAGGQPLGRDLQESLDPDGVIVLCGDSVASAVKRNRVPDSEKIERIFDFNPTYRNPFGPLLAA